jgi:AmpD protein
MNAVMARQTFLKERGFDPGPIDGIFGKKTEKANQTYRGSLRFDECFVYTPASYPGGNECKGVVWHHTDGAYPGSVEWTTRLAASGAYHCIVDRVTGNRTACVPDSSRAWHAGESHFNGREYCNGFMLGIAFSGDSYKDEISEFAYQSAFEWVKLRKDKYHWTTDWMTDHRTVAPGRKNDLNPKVYEYLMERLKDVLK